MSNNNLKRINFIKNKFNVVDLEKFNELSKMEAGEDDLVNINPNSDGVELKYSNFDDVLLYSKKLKLNKKTNQHYSVVNEIFVNEKLFNEVILNDPTNNKEYAQWILNLAIRLLKTNDISHLERLIKEDLPLAKEYLQIFNEVKNKRLFKSICKNNLSLDDIKDYSDINQYNSLSKLYISVEPYIERDSSELLNKLNEFAKSKEGIIPYRDRYFTLFIPKSQKASELFNDFASWCTCRKGNSNYESYRSNNKTPLGTKSDLFIIIDNGLFLPEDDPNHSNKIYQFHFETGQLMNKNNSSVKDLSGEIFDKSEGLLLYFKNHLLKFAKKSKNSKDNTYLKHLLKFGFTDSLFYIHDKDSMRITYTDKGIKKVPNLKGYDKLETLYLINCKIETIDPSLFSLKELTVLSMPKNDLKEIPLEMCFCKNLKTVNFTDNQISGFPKNITKLDPSNGGSLQRLSIRNNNLTESQMNKLKELLPNVMVVVHKEKEIEIN